MRIIRSEDEKVIAAQPNNSIYSKSSDMKYDYDLDVSFSEMQFRNEIAKDRIYGTANIKPRGKNKSVMKERLYKEAIEESSRIKTGGYYNQIFHESDPYFAHDNMPGRLKEKVNNEKVTQITDALTFNMNHEFDKVGNSAINHQRIRPQPQQEFEAEIMRLKQIDKLEPPVRGQQAIPKEQEQFEMPKLSAFAFENKVEKPMDFEKMNQRIMNQNTMGLGSMKCQPMMQGNEIQSPIQGNDMYEDIMNKLNDDIIKQSKEDPQTRIMDSGRQAIRDDGAKKNNIPYKKTELFEKGLSKDKENGLVVRDCKGSKNGIQATGEQGTDVLSWICSGIVMIVPIIGFVISGIVSLVTKE